MSELELQVAAALTWLPLIVAMAVGKAPFPHGVSSIVLAIWIAGTNLRIAYLVRDPGVTVVPSFTTLEESIEYGVWTLAVASVLTALGYVIGRGARQNHGARARGRREEELTSAKVLDRQLVLLGLAALALGTAGVGSIVYLRFGSWIGLEELFQEVTLKRTVEVGEGGNGNYGMFSALVVPAEIVAGGLAWRLAQRGQASRKMLLSLGALLGGCVLVGVGLSIMFGGRQGVLTAVLVPLWIYLCAKRVSAIKAILSGIGVTVALAPLVVMQGMLRTTGESPSDIGISSAVATLVDWIGGSGHFVAVERTGYIAEYATAGMNEFPTAMSVALGIIGLVPRPVFPDKPRIHEGNFVAEAIAGDYGGAGFPAGLVGGLVLNFGVLGMLGMLLYGVGVARLDAIVTRIRGRIEDAFWLAGLGELMTLGLLQSSIATSLTRGIVVVAWIWVLRRALAFAVRRGQHEHAAGGRLSRAPTGEALEVSKNGAGARRVGWSARPGAWPRSGLKSAGWLGFSKAR